MSGAPNYNYADDAGTSDGRVIVWALQDVKESIDTLVEQQRIANLIAAFQMEGGPYKAANNWTDGEEDANVRILREVSEGLGLA